MSEAVRERRARVRAWLVLLAGALAVHLVLGSGGERPAVEVAAAATAQGSGAISVIWGGDIALSAANALPGDGRAGLAAVSDPLMRSDLALVNLEGTLGTSGTSKCGDAAGGTCFAFQAPPQIARELAYAGVDAVNLANNHSFDAGPAGVQETTAALDAAEMAWTGLPGTVRDFRVAGHAVALVGFAPYEWADDLRDLALVRARVQEAARRAPLVIAMVHAGREGQDATSTPRGVETSFGEQRGDTRAAAHAMIDAGADLVLGSGPHVVRGIERYRGRVVVYSAGNLAGNDTLSLNGTFALAALVRLRITPDGRPLSGRVMPLALTPPGLPRRDPDRRAARIMDEAGAQDFGAGAVRVGADGVMGLG